MSDSFLTIEGGQKRQLSNTWRNIVFGAIIFVVLGGAGLYSYAESSKTEHIASRFSAVLSKDKVIELVYGAGNDHDPVAAPMPPAPPALPELTGTLPETKTFSAASIFVKDEKTGVVLFVKDGYNPRPMASITKLLSALVLLEHSFDTASTTQVVADDAIDSHVYARETYTLGQLWDAMLVASSNKAVLTLVDATGWTRESFVERMNQKAMELGMSDTHVVEPTGLDAQNVSTGSDISLLLAEALRYPRISEAVTKKEVIMKRADGTGERRAWSTNWLLTGWVPTSLTVIGGKTGFIDASLYNFAVRFKKEDGRMVDAVVLGASAHESRFIEARDITEAVLSAYTWPLSQE